MTNLVVYDKQPVGLAARCAEFFLVDLAEQQALIELDRPLQIAAQFLPADIQGLDLHPPAQLGAADKPGDPAPAPLQLLHPRVMQDSIKLFAQQRVDGRNVAVQRSAQRLRIRAQASRRVGAEPQLSCLSLAVPQEPGQVLGECQRAIADIIAAQHRQAQRRGGFVCNRAARQRDWR